MNTTHFLNRVMGNLFRSQTNPALPTQYWLGLSSTAPAIGGTGVTEPSTTGTGYARVQLTTLSTPTNGAVKNTAVVTFAKSLTAWSTTANPTTHYVIYDAATGGNLLIYGALDASRVVEPNTIFMFEAETLVLSLENPSS
jgi:hypothetical protein